MKKLIIIKKVRKENSKEISELIFRVFNKFIANNFEEQSIEKWLHGHSPREQEKRMKIRDIYVALDKNKIIGVIEGNKQDKIVGLFIDEKYQRQGIAKILVKRIELLYKKRGIKKIKIFSSLYAQKFYKKVGYKKSTKLIKKDGMVYQPMEKDL